MIEEAYCSFEVAKLLKEKGFDIICDKVYRKHDSYLCPFEYCMNLKGEGYYLAPTIQMAMRWIREVHHYYIQVMLDSWALGSHSGYYVVIQRTDNDFEIMLQDYANEVFYKTYEDAVEAALKYSLENLI